MASSLNAKYTETPYFKYKALERRALKMLFSNQRTNNWTLKAILSNAKEVEPSLRMEERKTIIECLEQSMEIRQEHSLRYKHAPWKLQCRHAIFVQLMNSITTLVKGPVRSKTKAPKGAVPQKTEALEDDVPVGRDDVTIDGDDMTLNEASFLHFLEEIDLLLCQALDLWRGKIHLSTAATRLCFLPFVNTSRKDIRLSILTSYSSDEHVPVRNRTHGEGGGASEPVVV